MNSIQNCNHYDEYDPNAWYSFTDSDGNSYSSRGDNKYIWASITKGIPINVDSKGDWYIKPYLEATPTGLLAHIPEWFRQTKEYNEWQQVWIPIINSTEMSTPIYNSAKEALDNLGEKALSNLQDCAAVNNNTVAMESTVKHSDTIDIENLTHNSTTLAVASTILVIVAAVIALSFSKNIKERIEKKKSFDAKAWAIANGIVGAGLFGIIFVILAHDSINQKAKRIRDKKYKLYYSYQMKDFIKVYSFCTLIWIVITLITITIQFIYHK